jgi:hypothetical protein
VWDTIVRFFKSSETILLARFQVLASALWAVAITFDYSPILSSTTPTKQQYLLSIILFIQGLATEVARRRNTVTTPQGTLQSKPPGTEGSG